MTRRSTIISGMPGWQAVLTKKGTVFGSAVGEDTYSVYHGPRGEPEAQAAQAQQPQPEPEPQE